MGIFLAPDDFPTIPDVADLIGEVETKAFVAAPALRQLTPDDNQWGEVTPILSRILKEWAAQGWEGVKSKTIGPFTKSWWLKAGRIDADDKAALRAIAATITGTRTTGPRWSAPSTYSLGGLFETGRRRVG